ncbi:MAG: PAS domain S-box protein [Actinomycetota bacterium]
MDDTTVGETGRLRPLSELSEAEVWAMVDGSPDGMVLVDELGVVLFVNSQMESMFGYDRGDLLGQPIEALLPERYRQIHAAHRTRYRADPTTRAMGSGLDLVARCANGDEFPVEISLSPIATDDGLRVVATVRDITDRLATEAQIHAVLRTIDAAHDAVFMFDPETLRFQYVNQGAVNQLGYRSEELLAMTPLHIKPDYTDHAFRELLAPLLAGDITSHTFTTTHRRKDGSDVPVEITIDYPSPAQPGQPRLLVALVRDITRRLRTEQATQAQQAKLQVLEDRERLARDLHDVVIQRLFAAGMGLQAVQALATDPALAERLAETVQQMDQTIDELRAAIFKLTTTPSAAELHVQQRIDHAAIGLGHQPLLRIGGDLDSIAQPVLEELLPTLSEALSNVARHARATETDVSIDVGTDSVVLTVTDNGIGLDPAAPRGNGLTNLEARADLLGGAASITSTADRGTTLTWTAPRMPRVGDA